jgi:hypothetical protein
MFLKRKTIRGLKSYFSGFFNLKVYKNLTDSLDFINLKSNR